MAMIDLNEIRIGESEINLKDNRVKTSILPQTSRELARNIKIQGNVIAESGIFGNNIDVEAGNVIFEGAVFANTELHIASHLETPVTFRKAVASADSVASWVTFGKVMFGSDINAKKIRLRNCYVGGSIYASEISLEHCVVLGGVFASKQAVITDCVIGTFHAPSAEIGGVNYLLYPACFSVEPLLTLPRAEIYNLSLAHLGALFKGEKEDENTGKIRLDLESDAQRTVLVDDDGTTTIVNSYSVSGRVLAVDMLDLNKLENHFLIGAGALGTQILKNYSLSCGDGSRSDVLTIENISTFFFKILDGVIAIQDLSGEILFEDLKSQFSD